MRELRPAAMVTTVALDGVDPSGSFDPNGGCRPSSSVPLTDPGQLPAGAFTSQRQIRL